MVTRIECCLDNRVHYAELNRRGKLDVRCAASYAVLRSTARKTIMLSCYVSATNPRARHFGSKTIPAATDVCVAREYIPDYTPETEQERRLEFMATIVATRVGVDFEHRLPISTRKAR